MSLRFSCLFACNRTRPVIELAQVAITHGHVFYGHGRMSAKDSAGVAPYIFFHLIVSFCVHNI